jgi:hypothetical protein
MAPSRRALLRAASAAVVGGLSGCAALDGRPSGPTPPRLGELRATNYDTEPHTVHVLLTADGDPAYWRSKRADAADADTLGGATFEGYPTDRGPYELHARIDDRPLAEAARFDVTDYEASCVGLRIAVGEADGTGSDVRIWYTTDSAVCGE